MRLPKPNLSKLVNAFKIFLAISILVPTFSIYAQAPNESVQTIDTSIQAQEATGSVAGATASDEKGEVKWILPAVGIGVLLLQALGVDVIGGITKGIDCITSFHSCVEGAVILTQNVVYKQSTGCNFDVPKNGWYQEESCSAQKLAALKDGSYRAQAPNGGFLDIASNVTNAAMQFPVPVSSSQYFASINPFKKATAAEETDVASGLAKNTTLLGIWTNVRNASYALIVLVLVVIGFMIMTRWRLDPRTVVTLQNSLPRLAVALLLITFSFAIAGFMADIIRVVSTIAIDFITGESFVSLTAMALLIIASMTGIGAAALAFVGGTIAAIALLFLGLLLVFAIIAVFINLIFKVLTRYVIFILLTLFAPLFFLFGALPGFEGVTVTWFRRMGAALVAIPAVALVLKLSFVIGFEPYLNTAGKLGASPNLPTPWFVPNPVDSILSWLVLGPVVGLGLFFFATKVPEIVDEAFGIRPLPRGGIGPGIMLAPIGLAAGGLTSYGRMGAGVRQLAVGNIPILSRLANRAQGWFPVAGKTEEGRSGAGAGGNPPPRSNLPGQPGFQPPGGRGRGGAGGGAGAQPPPP